MATLNITYQGISADYPLELDYTLSDEDVRRVAVEVLRSGGLQGLVVASVQDNAFDHYVVDRLDEDHIYLRPKVPFG